MRLSYFTCVCLVTRPSLGTRFTLLPYGSISFHKHILLYIVPISFRSLESIGQQMEFFEKETSVLSSWITDAMEKISKIRKLSDRDQQSIGVIRSKVDKLLVLIFFNLHLNQLNIMKLKFYAMFTGYMNLYGIPMRICVVGLNFQGLLA